LQGRGKRGMVEFRYMKQTTKKENKVMFWIGIIMIAASAISLIFLEKDSAAGLVVIGIIGIVFVGASHYKLMK